MGSADAWIAATALALPVPLVTNNPKDYRHLDRLQLVSVAAHNHLPPWRLLTVSRDSSPVAQRLPIYDDVLILTIGPRRALRPLDNFDIEVCARLWSRQR